MSSPRDAGIEEIQINLQRFQIYLHQHLAEGKAPDGTAGRERYRVAEEMAIRLAHIIQLMNDPSSKNSRDIQQKVKDFSADLNDKQLAQNLKDLADNPMDVEHMLSAVQKRFIVFVADPNIAKHQHFNTVKRKSPKILGLLKQTLNSILGIHPNLTNEDRGIRPVAVKKKAVQDAPSEPSSQSRSSGSDITLDEILGGIQKLKKPKVSVKAKKGSTRAKNKESRAADVDQAEEIDRKLRLSTKRADEFLTKLRERTETPEEISESRNAMAEMEKLEAEEQRDRDAKDTVKQLNQFAQQLDKANDEMKAGRWDNALQGLETLSKKQQQLSGSLAIQSAETPNINQNSMLLQLQSAEVFLLRSRLLERQIQGVGVTQKDKLRKEASALKSNYDNLSDQAFQAYLYDASMADSYKKAVKQYADNHTKLDALIADGVKHAASDQADKPMKIGQKGRKDLDAHITIPQTTDVVKRATSLLEVKNEQIGDKIKSAQAAIAKDNIEEAREILEAVCKQATNLHLKVTAFEKTDADFDVRQNIDPYLVARSIFSLQTGDAHLLLQYVVQRQMQSKALSPEEQRAQLQDVNQLAGIANDWYGHAFAIEKDPRSVNLGAMKDNGNIKLIQEEHHKKAPAMRVAIDKLLEITKINAIISGLKTHEMKPIKSEIARELKVHIDAVDAEMKRAQEAIARNDFGKAAEILAKITETESKFIAENIKGREPSHDKRSLRNTALLLSHTANAFYILGQLKRREADLPNLPTAKQTALFDEAASHLKTSKELIDSSKEHGISNKDLRALEDYSKGLAQQLTERAHTDKLISKMGFFKHEGKKAQLPPSRPSSPNLKKGG